MEGENSKYLIRRKNLCKCYNVLLPSTTTNFFLKPEKYIKSNDLRSRYLERSTK
jgi:hypothetical protein